MRLCQDRGGTLLGVGICEGRGGSLLGVGCDDEWRFGYQGY